MDAVGTLLSDLRVQAYFVVLGVAIWSSIRSYRQSCSSTFWGLVISLSILGVTWFYILRFILTNLTTSESYFDDAYKNVLQTPNHYFTSTQLLTWAIVAVVWISNSTSNNHAKSTSSISFLLFGFLGALSAAYTLWVTTTTTTNTKNSAYKTIPMSFAVFSLLAFLSILGIRPYDDDDQGSFSPHFRYCLQAMHLVLVLPVFVTWLWPSQPRMDATLLYFFLGATISIWHISQVVHEHLTWTTPTTDCQKSITIDLIGCTCITIYFIFQTDNNTLKSCFWALLGIPIISPAAVLAFYLTSIHASASHQKCLSYLQQLGAQRQRRHEQGTTKTYNKTGGWCNLGYWSLTTESSKDRDEKLIKSTLSHYDQACERLALTLGTAAKLGPDDSVLCCGCGSEGTELFYYKQQFQVRHITGIDPNVDMKTEAIRTTCSDDYQIRLKRAGVEDLCPNDHDFSTKALLFPVGMFQKILALDNVYHYADKFRFLKDSFHLLPCGGSLALTDIVVKQTRNLPFRVRAALVAMGIPQTNMWDSATYHGHLSTIGYRNIQIKRIGQHVFSGWSFLPVWLLEHVEYVVVTAHKGTNRKVEKKRVAVIGSGLAGLSAAHSILKSSKGGDIAVDIYESHDRPGLSGNTILVEGQLIDVPARMAATGYYSHYSELLKHLDLPTTVVRTDCAYYGTDGAGGNIVHSYEFSNLKNLYNALFRFGVKKIRQLMRAIPDFEQEHETQFSTFGDWLHKRFLIRSGTDPPSEHAAQSDYDFPSLSCHDHPLAYIIVGSIGWMLSCTYDQLLKYPVDIIFPYCRGLNLARLGLFRSGEVIRVNPSIRVLERNLLYGVDNLFCGKQVKGVGKDKVINGIKYDAVICATEASAVRFVVKDFSSVFDGFRYHPSTTIVHRDESFMPPNKKDWKCWNVEMSSGYNGPQLTFWLNAFIPDAAFSTNVFQTWAPRHQAEPELLLQSSRFNRVVHTEDTRQLVAELRHVQGKDGIYYAGSYSVYGMGLLEEALFSGVKAGENVLTSLFPGFDG